MSATFAHPTARTKVLEKHRENCLLRSSRKSLNVGLPFARCELRYHSLSQTFYIIEDLKGSRSPPPLTPPHSYTPYEQRA